MRRAFEAIKLAAICVLLLSLVCLAVFYMNSFRSVKTYEFTSRNDEAVRNRFYKSSYVELMSDELVSPYFIGVSVGGAKMGFLGGGVNALYELIGEEIAAVFSGSSYVERADAAEFQRCAEGDYLYIRYRCELPRSVVYYMLDTDMILEDVGDEYVFDMFVLPSERGAYAVTRDKSGNFYSFRPATALAINKNRLISYTYLEGAFAFSFAGEQNVDAALRSAGYYEKLDAYEIFAPSDFSATSAVAESVEVFGAGRDQEIMAILGMNPERVTSYDAEDGITYFDEGENLKINRGGNMSYSALSAQYGMPISSVIGYSVSEDGYSLTDFVGAALVLGDKLGVFDGGRFSYAITFFEPSGNGMIIEISHVYDGFSVLSGGGAALRVEFSDGNIVSVVCNYATAALYDGSSSVSDANWRLRAAVAESKEKFGLVYVQTMKYGRLYLSLLSVYGTEAADE